jgi:hypothetical protein
MHALQTRFDTQFAQQGDLRVVGTLLKRASVKTLGLKENANICVVGTLLRRASVKMLGFKENANVSSLMMGR